MRILSDAEAQAHYDDSVRRNQEALDKATVRKVSDLCEQEIARLQAEVNGMPRNVALRKAERNIRRRAEKAQRQGR
jgi:hypothetical protein